MVLGAPCFSFSRAYKKGYLFTFSSGINYFFARVCYQCRERELSTRKLEGYMDREGLFGVMSPGQQNKVPDSETGGCWGADRKARVTTDTARSCLEGKSR